jgi:hypothetical protein
MAPDAFQDRLQGAGGEVAGGTSTHASTRRPPASVEVPEPSTPQASSGDSEEGEDALGAQQHRKRTASRRSPPAGSLDHRHRKRRREEEVAPDSTSSAEDGEMSSEETDFSVSDQGGHDNRRPKRRISANDIGASKWTLEEWIMLLTSGDANDSKDSSDDDGKPQIHPNPSKSKNQWSAADVQRSISRSLRILQNRRKEAPFRALKLPDSIDWLEPEVMKGKR